MLERLPGESRQYYTQAYLTNKNVQNVYNYNFWNAYQTLCLIHGNSSAFKVAIGNNNDIDDLKEAIPTHSMESQHRSESLTPVLTEQPDATSSFILLGIENLTAGIAGIQFQGN
ncbi:hypothetical protein C1646_763441 [Rhizophagus diaphanus]|nr:hypothetical protein C1646_763441 [Rhizophagus diaphanus] [Rhizophagus sp. MUCL 43196]